MDDFELRLETVYPVLERYVQFRINGPDAPDIVQEVCLTAYRKRDSLKTSEAFKSWILAIARNKCSDYFRTARTDTVPLEEVPEVQLVLGRQGITVQSAVADTLEMLNNQDRQILELIFWQEMPHAQVAEHLGIPLGTVKSRLHHAKARFRANYPYPPEKSKGEETMGKMPIRMPDYTIEKLDGEPFECKWEEMQGWLIVPRVGEKLRWGMYDFPEKKLTSWCDMKVVGRAEVHGIEGVEITAVQYGAGDDRDKGFKDSMERRFIAQLTDTHTRYLAESHVENGVRKCYTFLDGEEFSNWSFGAENCGNEIHMKQKGLITREGSVVTAPKGMETIDVVGRYCVRINEKTYDTVCVMDAELYNEAVVSEQFIDRSGRTVLWRRFNRDDWAIESFGGKRWSEKLPDNERITVNGETYVHWYDCISEYIL